MKDIMIAFFKGFAGLVTAFFIRARSKGFDIMLLTIISGILFWRSLNVESTCEAKITAIESKMERQSERWLDSLNRARTDFLECDKRRQALEIKVAELTARMEYLSKK